MSKNITIIDSGYYPQPWQREVHDGIEKHRFSIVLAHRQAGKTFAMVNHILKQAVANRQENPRYAYVAPTLKQAKLVFWDLLKSFASKIPGIKISETYLTIGLPNQATIMLLGTRRLGYSGYLDGVVLDEPGFMPDDIWPNIFRPMLDKRKGWGVLIGTAHSVKKSMWPNPQNDSNWFSYKAPASKTKIFSDDILNNHRNGMGEKLYNEEYECHWE